MSENCLRAKAVGALIGIGKLSGYLSIFFRKCWESKVVSLFRSDIFTLFLFTRPSLRFCLTLPRLGYVSVCRKVGYTPVWNLNNYQELGEIGGKGGGKSPSDDSAMESKYCSYFIHPPFFRFLFLSLFLYFFLFPTLFLFLSFFLPSFLPSISSRPSNLFFHIRRKESSKSKESWLVTAWFVRMHV